MKNISLFTLLMTTTLSFSLSRAQERSVVDFQKMNRIYHKMNLENSLTKSVSHKLPDFFIDNDLLNLNVFSTAILEDLRSTPKKGKFSTLSIEQVDGRNAHGLLVLEQFAVPTINGISRSQAMKLLKRAHEHPVVGIDALKTYDPNPPNLPETNRHGFCFGRADFLFYELLKMGVAKNSILKLFQIGAIYGDPNFGRPWSNHIVTIVRAKEGGWYAIDPFYNELMTPSQWVAKNRGFAEESNFKTLAYVGRPTRMHSQGSRNTAQAIADDTIPSGRDRVVYIDDDGTKKTLEVNFVFKDASFKRYYSAMVKAVLETNVGHHKDYFCHVSQLCEE